MSETAYQTWKQQTKVEKSKSAAAPQKDTRKPKTGRLNAGPQMEGPTLQTMNRKWNRQVQAKSPRTKMSGEKWQESHTK